MKITIRELVTFAMLSEIMVVSKVIMEGLPNIHLVGTFVVAFTLTYRAKALFPIYGYVFINGLWEGFEPFGWLPEVYIWLILWAAVMILPKNMPKAIAPYPVHICALRLDDERVNETANKLYTDLENAGIECLFDDRNVSGISDEYHR